MAGLEGIRDDGSEGLSRILCYERSGEVEQVSESSASYASAFTVM